MNRSRGSGKIRWAGASPFWQHFFPRLQQTFPGTVDDVNLDDFVWAINDVERSFIRVEADEATYNLHIILRFEMEQALVNGDLAAGRCAGGVEREVSADARFDAADHAQGCLQDIHWSMGGLGYFPTYTLGNLYAAQFMDKARQDLSDLDGMFRQGNFAPLKQWLNTNIHQPGQRYRPRDLCQRVTGKPLSHKPLLEYLWKKYGSLYGIA